jgi:hypothetical protein
MLNIKLRLVLALSLGVYCLSAAGAVVARPQSTGTLRVKTDTADVIVWLDGEEVGKTPLTLRTLSTGKHRLVLAKDGYEDHSQEIDVSTNQPNSIFVVMKPRTVQLPPLPAEFKVIHQHRTGSCVGVLTVSAEFLDYKASNDADQFHIPIATIKSVARSWGATAGLMPMGIRGPTDLMAFRVETPGRSYGFLAFKDSPDDPMKIGSEKTRELYDLVYRLWSATLSKKPN